jgi:hypothetical protein
MILTLGYTKHGQTVKRELQFEFKVHSILLYGVTDKTPNTGLDNFIRAKRRVVKHIVISGTIG